MKDLRNKISFHLMRMVRSQKSRDYFVRKKIRQIPSVEIPQGIGKKLDVNSDDLICKGYTDLGMMLSESEVNTLFDKIKDLECFDPYRSELGTFKIEDVDPAVHVANYSRKDLVKIKEILDIANNSEILKAVENFLGAAPTISNINMWWSLSDKEKAEEAQLFHRDVDDFKFCKLFIYLTDVAMDNGPHVYVEGSSTSEKLRKIRRYKDEEISEAFGEESIKFFTAPKGSAFIVDTYGFHKGLLPQKGNRLLLQVQYSLSKIGIEQYDPVKIGDHSYNSYINRLIISN